MKACASLGYAYQLGIGVAPSATRAVEFYRKACDGGLAAACDFAGMLLGKGSYVAGNYLLADAKEAARLFRKGCEGGHPHSCLNFGMVGMAGRGDGPVNPLIVDALQKACDGGEGRGCVVLSGLYWEGLGVAPDKAKACAFANRANLLGAVESYRLLGIIYETGQGAPQDAAKAMEYYRQGCEKGDKYACTEQARMMSGSARTGERAATGDDGGGNAEAFALYEKACGAGDHLACCRLRGAWPDTIYGVARDGLRLEISFPMDGFVMGSNRRGADIRVEGFVTDVPPTKVTVLGTVEGKQGGQHILTYSGLPSGSGKPGWGAYNVAVYGHKDWGVWPITVVATDTGNTSVSLSRKVYRVGPWLGTGREKEIRLVGAQFIWRVRDEAGAVIAEDTGVVTHLSTVAGETPRTELTIPRNAVGGRISLHRLDGTTNPDIEAADSKTGKRLETVPQGGKVSVRLRGRFSGTMFAVLPVYMNSGDFREGRLQYALSSGPVTPDPGEYELPGHTIFRTVKSTTKPDGGDKWETVAWNVDKDKSAGRIWLRTVIRDGKLWNASVEGPPPVTKGHFPDRASLGSYLAGFRDGQVADEVEALIWGGYRDAYCKYEVLPEKDPSERLAEAGGIRVYTIPGQPRSISLGKVATIGPIIEFHPKWSASMLADSDAGFGKMNMRYTKEDLDSYGWIFGALPANEEVRSRRRSIIARNLGWYQEPDGPGEGGNAGEGVVREDGVRNWWGKVDEPGYGFTMQLKDLRGRYFVLPANSPPCINPLPETSTPFFEPGRAGRGLELSFGIMTGTSPEVFVEAWIEGPDGKRVATLLDGISRKKKTRVPYVGDDTLEVYGRDIGEFVSNYYEPKCNRPYAFVSGGAVRAVWDGRGKRADGMTGVLPEGDYRVTVKVVDIYGNPDSETVGFRMAGPARAESRGRPPDSANAYEEALAAYNAGDYTGAWRRLEAFLKANPSSWEGWQLLGNCQYAYGDRAGALKSYEYSLQLNPDNAQLKAWAEQVRGQ